MHWLGKVEMERRARDYYPGLPSLWINVGINRAGLFRRRVRPIAREQVADPRVRTPLTEILTEISSLHGDEYIKGQNTYLINSPAL